MIECKTSQPGQHAVTMDGNPKDLIVETSMIISVLAEDMFNAQIPKDIIVDVISKAVATGIDMGLKLQRRAQNEKIHL